MINIFSSANAMIHNTHSDIDNARAHAKRAAGQDILPEPKGNLALFLDIDGTLSDIAPTPSEAFIALDILQLLKKLEDKFPVALISGRNITSIDAMTFPYLFPASGQHGLEWRTNSEPEIITDENMRKLFAMVADEVKTLLPSDTGLMVENKGVSIAVHYRNASHYEEVVIETLTLFARRHAESMALQKGKMVAELHAPGSDKGKAVSKFMETASFAGRTPVYIGDDITDEYGFDAVNRLGGISIKVGLGPTQAFYRAANPHHIKKWLQSVEHNALEGKDYE